MHWRSCVIPLVLVVSCTPKEDNSNVVPLGQQPMQQRFSAGKPLQRDAKGNWPAEVRSMKLDDGDRKSDYFTSTSNLPKAYKAGEFKKAAWWGDKSYPRKPYTGNTDGSRFQVASKAKDKTARETGTAADVPGPYQTGTYRTGDARESSGKRIGKTSDAETDIRREVFPEPDVADWKQQREMDIRATKSILGRE